MEIWWNRPQKDWPKIFANAHIELRIEPVHAQVMRCHQPALNFVPLFRFCRSQVWSTARPPAALHFLRFILSPSNLPKMAEQEPNWRGQVPREERVRVLNHILGKIREFSSETPENSLKEKICKLESKSYSSATSHSDYLEKIANAIGHIQKHTKQGQAKQAFANFAQGNLTNQQTQAVLRQQLRQRQQEAFLRRTQLMGPRQLQQYQAQQESLQQQHKQQDPNRQSSTPVQRPQGSASDPKVC